MMSHNIIPRRMPENAVAVIGAGPAGLVSAAWLKRHGFDPVVFETAERLGGQWNADSPMSGTWPGMRTNTSRIMTAFSDLDHPPMTAIYPTQAEVLNYLERYAELTGIDGHIHFSRPVVTLDRWSEEEWLVVSNDRSTVRSEIFSRVVVATGRYNAPKVPYVEGLDTFSGAGDVSHSFSYKGPSRYRDMNVLVAGCSISALEIASELALAGARSVTVSYRRQRYILQKLLAGVPTEHAVFTRFAALASAVLPPADLAAGMRDLVLRTSGSPEQFGAFRPDENIFAAGIAQSQSFLALVAEGRIKVRPWMERVEGQTVGFTDGTQSVVDAVLMGTGYRLSLPFLSKPLAETVNLDDQHIDLYDHTFHPDLPGLAFMGMFDQVGPLFPVLELQARWLAYGWAGIVHAPSAQTMREGIGAYRARRGTPQEMPMHIMATLFARHAGVEPNVEGWPDLQRALLFGPLSPASFRLYGPDSQLEAPERTARAAAAFGAIQTPHMLPAEERQWNVVKLALADKAA